MLTKRKGEKDQNEESPLIPSEQTSNGNGSAFDASEKKLDAGSGGTVVEGAEPPDDRCCLSRLCDFPASIFFIIGNEFCERFSYYGMKAVLVLYCIASPPTGLGLSANTATVVFHAFSMINYFLPLFGGILADNWIGKFWTILILSCVYAAGNVVMAVTSIPMPAILAGAIVGLLLIAFGSGGIKPCVCSFGADQFGSSEREKRSMSRFFSIFYFFINVGSLLSIIVSPVLRADVQCFGTSNCYSLAFGVPAILMVTSIVVFLIGFPLYKRIPPQGNVVVSFCGCIFHAIGKSWTSPRGDSTPFLDRASDRYDPKFIADVRQVLRVLVLFLPVPLFWALFDQQGSRWTLQAAQMDYGFILPDQVQVVNPLLILILIPIFNYGVYPLLGLCNVLTYKRLPHRMVVGGLFAALAFGVAAILQAAIDPTQPPSISSSRIRIQTSNLLSGYTLAYANGTSSTASYLSSLDQQIASTSSSLQFLLSPNSATTAANSSSLAVVLTGIGSTAKSSSSYSQSAALLLTVTLPTAALVGGSSYRLLLMQRCTSQTCTLYAKLISVATTKADNGYSYVRFQSLLADTDSGNFIINTYKSDSSDIYSQFTFTGEIFVTTSYNTFNRNNYNVKLLNGSNVLYSSGAPLQVLNGAALTVVMTSSSSGTLTLNSLQDMQPNSVSVFWQLPQYTFLTIGEVLFSISGLEFAYQQAPLSMKSLLSACWLLTVAIGNLFVLLVAQANLFAQAVEFLIFALLMVFDILVFAVLAYFYRYREDSSKASLIDASHEHKSANGDYQNAGAKNDTLPLEERRFK